MTTTKTKLTDAEYLAKIKGQHKHHQKLLKAERNQRSTVKSAQADLKVCVSSTAHALANLHALIRDPLAELPFPEIVGD